MLFFLKWFFLFFTEYEEKVTFEVQITALSSEVKLEVKEEVDDELKNGFEVLDTMTFDFQF